MSRFARRFAVVGLAVLAPLLTRVCGIAAQADAQPVSVVYDCVGAPQVRPSQIIFTCADVGLRVDSISWQRWGPQRAFGTGIEWANLCSPDCAAGNYRRTPVKITLMRLSEPGNWFTTATLTDNGGHVEIEQLPPPGR